MPSIPPPVVAALRRIVGAAHVRDDPGAVAGHVRDWTGRFVGATPAVVRPGSVEEVAAVLAWCAAEGVAVVPQGGNTGLVGGSVPLAGEVVLHLGRLDRLDAVDVAAGQVTAGAGVTLARLQAHAAGHGLALPLDLAARDSATVGGMVATNAGGTRAMRHGPMRAQLRGIEAVLSGGSVLSHLGGLVKDNTGYDLAGLLCGSEGTLAVVTAARVRLLPVPEARSVALLGLASVEDAVATLVSLRRQVPSLEAAELFFEDGLTLVCGHLGLARPLPGPHPAYLLVEAADRAAADPAGQLAAALAGPGSLVVDAAVATDGLRATALWRYREAHTEAIALEAVAVRGGLHKLDVTVPIGQLPAFVPAVAAAVATVAPAARVVLFGHAGDGNLHVNVLDPAVTGRTGGDAVDGAVLGLVASMGGSISAEHGIGTAKRAFLHLARTPAEIAAFRAVKAALDPAGILNPNVLLPPG